MKKTLFAALIAISTIGLTPKVQANDFANDILQKLNQKEILGCEGIKCIEETDIPTSVRVWDLTRDGDGQLQAMLTNGDLNEQRFEIRTWDQIQVEIKAIRLDKLDQLKGM